MDGIEWWESLDQDAKEWLIEHNGETLPPEVLTKIVAAAGAVDSDPWWLGENTPDGLSLSDEAVDRLEAIANDEAS